MRAGHFPWRSRGPTPGLAFVGRMDASLYPNFLVVGNGAGIALRSTSSTPARTGNNRDLAAQSKWRHPLPFEFTIEHRLHVQDRCSIEGFQVAHADSCAFDRDNCDSVQSDWIGPVGGASAKDAPYWVRQIVARTHPQDVTACPIKPGQHDDVGTGPKVTQSFAHDLLKYEPGIG